MMFCPKCGRECKDGRFCMGCGTRLPEEAVELRDAAPWRPGMACPFCGANEVEGNRCAYCGGVLEAEENGDTEKVTTHRERVLLTEGVQYCPQCLSTDISVTGWRLNGRRIRNDWIYLGRLVDIVGNIAFLLKVGSIGKECCCMECGNSWTERRKTRQEEHILLMDNLLEGDPYRDYDASDDRFLRIGKESITVFSKGKPIIEIEYKDLREPLFDEGMSGQKGYMTIRSRRKKVQQDRLGTLNFEEGDAKKYRQIYDVLCHIAGKNV